MISELWLLAGALVGISIGAAATILITAKRYCEAAPMDRTELDALRGTLGDHSRAPYSGDVSRTPSGDKKGPESYPKPPRGGSGTVEPKYYVGFGCGECD